MSVFLQPSGNFKIEMKKYTSIFLFLLCSLLYSCSGNSGVKIPDDVLPKEKMAEVMVDIHLLEAAMNVSISTTDKVGISENQMVVDVFNKHNVTRKQYEDSYLFYTRNPELLEQVYELVLNDLSKMQAQITNGK